ncbi:hypothetical protein [Paraburkholderia phenoliruptrix]|uniref:hypothetical protein n=1 Tax=Paraburkholderia phenoliruptrix TaxID=252970 RepID=UPI002869E746|nr:hypothetical protein [Paraburkholderia phenoliruptrix]WMY08269.1 hypothetical protein P3F88_00365 [Paraburkholderia phenoliruptrix]
MSIAALMWPVAVLRRAFWPRAIPLKLHSLFAGIQMLKRPSMIPAPSSRQEDHVATRKARAEALRQAETDRAQKRLDGDARIDVNAAKWRYVSSRE